MKRIKFTIFLVVSLMAVNHSSAQNLKTFKAVPENPTTEDEVRIIYEVSIAGSGYIMEDSMNTLAHPAYVRFCYYSMEDNQPATISDTIELGKLGHGDYVWEIVAFVSDDSTTCFNPISGAAKQIGFTVTSATPLPPNTYTAKVEQVNTGMKHDFYGIEKTGDKYFLKAAGNYLSRCTGSCDTLVELSSPSEPGFANAFLSVIDSSTLFMLSQNTPYHNRVYRSTDGGNNWEMLYDSSSDHFVQSFTMFDTSEGVMTATFYKSFLTKDGGRTWDYGPMTGLIGVSAFKKFDENTICMGILERFHISRNRGKSWTGEPFVQANPRDFHFLNGDTIFSISSGNFGLYFSYALGALNWNHRRFTHSIEPWGLYFKSLFEGYLVGSEDGTGKGIILKTTDLGRNWTFYRTDIETDFTDIEFINDSIALITGTNGVLLKWNTRDAYVTGIPETSYELDGVPVNIYPNPASGKQTLSLSLENPSEVNIRLYDLSGRLITCIYNGKAAEGIQNFEIDLSACLPGIYFCKVCIAGGAKTFKVIRQ